VEVGIDQPHFTAAATRGQRLSCVVVENDNCFRSRYVGRGQRCLPVIVRLVGTDHTRRTVRQNGIDRCLTDVHGYVVHYILA
jgi:hypothetical protein